MGKLQIKKKKIYFNQFKLFVFNKCYTKRFSVGATIEEEWDAAATITKKHVLLMRLMTSTKIQVT